MQNQGSQIDFIPFEIDVFTIFLNHVVIFLHLFRRKKLFIDAFKLSLHLAIIYCQILKNPSVYSFCNVQVSSVRLQDFSVQRLLR
jgi:hypothetical protein